MIKALTVKNLNNKITKRFEFNTDLNILTGKNGSGKTTILKLIWYLISGNYSKLFDEMYFDFVRLELTENRYMQIEVKDASSRRTTERGRLIKFHVVNPKNGLDFEATSPFPTIDTPTIFRTVQESLFFSTFRRVEGGFKTDSKDQSPRYYRNSLKEAFSELTEVFSHDQHKFIATISTDDIEFLISKKYADIYEKVRHLESELSNSILNIVEMSNHKEKQSLQDIREVVNQNRKQRDELLMPLYILSRLIGKIFLDKSIHITKNIVLGQSDNAIQSDRLSAGEKQMLSFLCYNFFYENTVIFIDEPELSLNVDWQRLLFPTLLKQKNNNQFIIATHSPFVYTKYPEKEILIGSNKG